MSNSSSVTSTVKGYYDKLFQDGFLVSVHVSKWGMATQLETRDLGLNNEDKKLPRIFKLGKKMLIAPERLSEFSSIEDKARRFLKKSSFNFPVADAHFVPKKKLTQVLTKLEEFRKAFMEVRDTFVANYEVYKKEILDVYPELSYMAGVYPSTEEIGSKFDFKVSIYEMSMPREFAVVDIQTLISREKAEEDVKKQFEKQLQGYYDQSIKQLEQFVSTAATAWRSQVIEACAPLMEKIKSGSVVTKNNIVALRDAIQELKSLNIFDDAAITKKLTELETEVAVLHNYRSDKEALNSLTTALTGVLDKVTSVNAEDLSENYFRAIKL